jgi:hypothetical protein
MTAPNSARREAITIRPVGGLGNQLFIYAAGRAAATRLCCPLLVDPTTYAFPMPGETPRRLELDWLITPEQLLEATRPRRTERISRGLQRRFPALAPDDVLQEAGFAYDPRIEQVGPGVTLRGYFQSWRYFTAIESALRTELLAKAPTSQWSEGEQEILGGLGRWIGVHVRRGDYLQPFNARHHGVLGPSYYRSAIERLIGHTDMPLVVFSDDPEAARMLIQPLHPIAHTVIAPKQAHPMETIRLMAGADGLAIANSSFSWWGAWLAGPSSTRTVAPIPWFVRSGNDERELCPPQWMRIDSECGA